MISSELVGKEHVDCVLPKDYRIQALYNIKKLRCKKDVQIFCGMLLSLQQWNPSILMNIPALRKATGSRGKFEWTLIREEEYKSALKLMKTQIRLSPYNPKQKFNLVIDGIWTTCTGCLSIQISMMRSQRRV